MANKRHAVKRIRPAILERPVAYFEGKHSRIPERIRISFDDGTTAVYDLHVEQPEPIIQDQIVLFHREIGYQFRGDRR